MREETGSAYSCPECGGTDLRNTDAREIGDALVDGVSGECRQWQGHEVEYGDMWECRSCGHSWDEGSLSDA